MSAPRNHSKPNSRAHRRPEQRSALVRLPSDGCDLPVPPLPAGRTWTDAEQARWAELWAAPQAVMWDDSSTGTVAVLVVYEALILAGEASAWHAQEARYATEALGLTPRAMAHLGWTIADE